MHTIVIGTSKSKNELGYYIESKNKFWGLLYKSGLTNRLLEPHQYQTLIDEYGISFSELAFDHIFLGDSDENEAIKNDKLLNDQINVLNEGIPKLINYINSVKPKRIVFNGKATASAFYQFINKKNVDKLSVSYINQLGYNYGKIGQWNGLDVWMLPNLSNAAGNSWLNDHGEEKWLSFWKQVALDKSNKKKNKLWFWLLLAIVATTAILLIKK